MVRLKPTVTHLRVTIVAVNLLLTTVVGAHAVYRAMNPSYAEENRRLQKLISLDPNQFVKPPNPRARTGQEALRVAGLSEAFRPKPPPPPPMTTPAGEGGELAGAQDEEVLEGGPLEDEWEYSTPVLFHQNVDAHLNFVVLSRKSAAATRSRVSGISRTSSAARRVARNSRARPNTRRPPAQATDKKILYLYDSWTLEEEGDAGPTIWVVEISPEEFIYEVEGDWKRYSLKRKQRSIYRTNAEGLGVVEPPAPEEGEEVEGTEDDAKKHFVINAPLVSRKDAYEDRKNPSPTRRSRPSSTPGANALRPAAPLPGSEDPTGTGAAAGADAGAGDGGPTTSARRPNSSRSVTRLSAEEQKEQMSRLRDSMKEIEQKQLSSKDRAEFEKLKRAIGNNSTSASSTTARRR